MGESFADLDRKLTAVSKDLQSTRVQMARVGEQLRPEIDHAVERTLGDLSMSGWRRSGPIEIVGTSRTVSDNAVRVEPVKRAKGPMAVLERGRNTGGSTAMAGPGVSADGTTRRNKNGSVRKVRARKGRRWNGYTESKGTMSDAAEAIQRRAPGLINDEVVEAILRKRLG